MDYYSLLEQLTDLMTSLDEFDVPAIFAALRELCKLLRISKGVTTYYENDRMEAEGNGAEFVCYDSGERHRLVSSMRRMTLAQAVVTCSVYQAENAPALNEQERKRVAMIQRMMLTLISQSRQERIIDHLIYEDEQGYHNYRYYNARLSQLYDSGELAGKAAARINLRHFGTVNEELGRQTGDLVLQRYCRMLQDVLGPGAVLCRVYSDNYMLLFDDARLPEVEAFLRGVPVAYEDEPLQRLTVSATAGICRFPAEEDVCPPTKLQDRVMTAYMAARRPGGSGIVYYTHDLEDDKKREDAVRRDFEEALQTGEFVAYYQPKVDVHTGRLVGAEALCRWLRQGRTVMPMDFIPVLEQDMEICRLDFYMLDLVCRDIRRWLDEGRPAVPVSVNMSRKHMLDPDLFAHILEVVDRNRCPHELIEVELTETTSAVEFAAVAALVNDLQRVGIKTSVDDFGTGYSSLNLIQSIPWDIIKLDRSILPTGAPSEERSGRLFSHVVSMAHDIGMKCVAEGVETDTQLAMMKVYGCRVAQGYLFDRPLPTAEFEKRLDAGKYNIGAGGQDR